MLEKPDIPDASIISRLQDEYVLRVDELTFLPIGADMRTAVYRVVAGDGTAYFLKLRRNFRDVVVLVPLLLRDNRIQEILVPFQTKSGQHWADFGEYKLILYPFIEGKDGFEKDLTGRQRRILGKAFKEIHSTKIPQELINLIRRESFSTEWREAMKSFLNRVKEQTFEETTAQKLAEYIKHKQNEIGHLIERTEELASQLQSATLDLVLCHSDIHGGNILIAETGEIYIVDWDDPILSPKERDLMFFGGGIDKLWKTEQERAMFYQGYGEAEINLPALAYYRYERVIEDLALICEQILLTDEGGADREQGYRWFTSNFEPGSTIEIAQKTDNEK